MKKINPEFIVFKHGKVQFHFEPYYTWGDEVYLLLLSNQEIKTGDSYFREFGSMSGTFTCDEKGIDRINGAYYAKILGHLPLHNAEPWEDEVLLPNVKEDFTDDGVKRYQMPFEIKANWAATKNIKIAGESYCEINKIMNKNGDWVLDIEYVY
jgi:hypothetical protein